MNLKGFEMIEFICTHIYFVKKVREKVYENDMFQKKTYSYLMLSLEQQKVKFIIKKLMNGVNGYQLSWRRI